MVSGAILVLHAGHDTADRMRRRLMAAGYKVTLVSAAAQLKTELDRTCCDLLIAEDFPPLLDGPALLLELRPRYPQLPIVMVSRIGDMARVVSAIQAGANDYLAATCADELLLESVERALVGRHSAPAKNEQVLGGSIIFGSANMRQLLTMAEKIAASPATVTIQGESGTGKELLARFIHNRSGRLENPFVAMNCAALPENLAESELFGYERGAFTGADQRKPGKFEQADGGTLLLDEIGEMPSTLQAKLLRALQEKQIDRVGGRKSVSVEVRVIATTNRDLAHMVREGQFRQDLYYRLRVIPLLIPPLRQRREDIPLLAEFFISKYYRDGGPIRFSNEALCHMNQWQWPGNVRELENVVARAVLICDDMEIGPQHLLLDTALAPLTDRRPGDWVGMTVRNLEQKLIFDTLSHVDQNRTQAARMLGISIRTLRNKLREYRDTHVVMPRAAEGP
jgi:two-component system, response regulator FlrC